ncbi:hypothetical protein SGODD07_01289 [Streptococcus gordonii]|uniref:Uncharacterized protein n=1 Tax=Streptococcus gordonii TaxID=1302 RepID=A0A139N5G6_STRGN|nr:hypothetical protein SGODD07_01289 [Streptococcus gordonii]
MRRNLIILGVFILLLKLVARSARLLFKTLKKISNNLISML